MTDDLDRDDPFALFADWLAEASEKEINDPTGMAISTVDEDGLPDVRMVLMRAHGPDGFVFYTNYESAKGRQLLTHPKAALLFHWKSLRRQVRVRGLVTPATEAEADAYFAARPRNSRIGAWASDQSRPLDARATLERRMDAFTERFGDGPVPRPPHWSGFRITPLEIEFWKDGAFRLHDRAVFRRGAPDQPWVKTRLYP